VGILGLRRTVPAIEKKPRRGGSDDGINMVSCGRTASMVEAHPKYSLLGKPKGWRRWRLGEESSPAVQHDWNGFMLITLGGN